MSVEEQRMTVPRLHRSRRRHTYSKSHRKTFLFGFFAAAAILLALLRLTFSPSLSLVRYRQDESVPAYDVVVIGSGPAGLTAALYASRSGWNVLVFGSLADSQLAQAQVLDNFPSSNRNGLDFLQTTKKALQNVHFAQPLLRVSGLSPAGSLWRVHVDKNESVHGRSVILATGSVPRRLGLEHEDKLWGKHVHSCAVCDGSAYSSNQTVVVVGGGDAAVDAALLLSRQVANVIVVHRRTTFRASNRRNLEAMKARHNIEIHTPYELSEYRLKVQQQLTSVNINHVNKKTSQSIACDGVFLLLGSTPNTKFLQQTVRLDNDGYVQLQATTSTQTSAPGVFAAGDVADRVYHQAVTATGTGAQAALDAEAHLRLSKQRALPTITNIQWKMAVERTKTPPPPPTVDEKGCDMTKSDCIQSIVKKYPVVVFSKPWCPYCRKALQAFDQEGINPHVINLTDRTTARRIQLTLSGLSGGRRTVPNVFVGGTSIGGGDETVALHKSGRLQTLLIAAKAL